MLRMLSMLPKVAAFTMPLSPMLMAHAGSGVWEKRGAFALNIGAFVLFAMFPLALWLPALGVASWGGAFWCGTAAMERLKRERELDKEWQRWEKIARTEKWKQTARGVASAPVDLAGRAYGSLPSRDEAAAMVANLKEKLPALPWPSMPSMWSRKDDKSGSSDQTKG